MNGPHDRRAYAKWLSVLASETVPRYADIAWQSLITYLKGSVKEPNKFHNYETEKITRKASDAAEYIELFDSFTRDRHA